MIGKNWFFQSSKGFTMIELLITVAIIGILAVIAIPNFLSYQCRSKQSEAKTNLAAISNLQEAYYANQNAYRTCADHSELLADLGWRPTGNTRYAYSTTATDGGHGFVSSANATLGSKNDVWEMGEDRELENVTPGCN